VARRRRAKSLGRNSVDEAFERKTGVRASE